MTLKEYLKSLRIAQVEIASHIGAPISSVNLFINGWKPLPEKHVKAFAKYLKLSEDEVKAGKVTSHEKAKRRPRSL